MSELCLKNKTSIDPVEFAGQIITEYEGFIRSIIRTQNSTNLSEDDLFQDFYLALAAKAVPDNIRDTKSYLYKAIINHISSSYKRVSVYEKKITNFRKFYNFKVNKSEPTSALIIKEDITNVLEVIRKNIPNKKYMAITLRYRDGYTVKEIAEKMNIKYTSVTRYISTGLRKVRQCISNT